MPLQDLVEYFNDRFELEHRSTYRPFILENGEVSGLFGPIRIDSIFFHAQANIKAHDHCRPYRANYRCYA